MSSVFKKTQTFRVYDPSLVREKNRCTGYAIHKVLGLSSEIRESCPLHILPPMPTSSHWWDWKKPQKSFRRTSAKMIRNNTPASPVAQHFNPTGQSISDVQVRGVALCSGINIQRKQREMRLIFQLSTVQLKGLNIIFSFAWSGTFYHFYVYNIA